MESVYHAPRSFPSLPALCWRHKFKMFAAGAIIIALTLTYLSLSTRKYLSEAKVFVRIGRESVTLDPTATTGQFVAVSESRDSEVNAVNELLLSRGLAEKVVDHFGPLTILEKKSSGSLSKKLNFLNPYNLNPLRVYSVRDKAIAAFQKNLGTTAGRKTSVVSVSYKAQDPRLAKDVLEQVIVLAKEEHLQVNRTKGSLQFFDEQATLLHDEVDRLEGELRDLKNETGLAALAIQREIHLGLIGSLEAEMLRAQAELQGVEQEVAARKRQLGDLPAMVVTEQTTGQPQTPRLSMRERLYELEIREQELASKLRDDSPLLAQVRDQIAEARRIVTEEETTTQVTRGVNQAHQAVELALQERSAQLVNLQKRTESLEEKIAGAKAALKAINENEVKLTSLERELELARANHRKYAEHLEQARIDQELHNAKISSLNLMQPPTFSETPVSPQPLLTLALGFVAAVCGSLAVALGAERFRPSRGAPATNGEPVPPPVITPSPAASRLRPEHVPANPR